MIPGAAFPRRRSVRLRELSQSAQTCLHKHGSQTYCARRKGMPLSWPRATSKRPPSFRATLCDNVSTGRLLLCRVADARRESGQRSRGELRPPPAQEPCGRGARDPTAGAKERMPLSRRRGASRESRPFPLSRWARFDCRLSLRSWSPCPLARKWPPVSSAVAPI